MTTNEDQIAREHRERGEGEGLTPGSRAWWRERATRHTLPADQVLVLGRIEDFDPTQRITSPASARRDLSVPPGVVPSEAEIEEILANLTGEEDVEP